MVAEAEVKKKINPSFKQEKLSFPTPVSPEPLEVMIFELRRRMEEQKECHEREIIRVSDNLRQIAEILTFGSLIAGFILGALSL
jgi:hypothetical protein